MALPAVDSGWLQALQAQSRRGPLKPRVPLWAGSAVIGSVEPDFIDQIGLYRNPDGDTLLSKVERLGSEGWLLTGCVTTGLNQLALAMHACGLAGAWRNEQLAVCDARGQRLGTVERAAVRPLGIATMAVHLVGQASDGRFWVQQRAFDKPNDPGKWDTLMGGMVSAADTLETALTRETWEEAGLRIASLQSLRRGGRLGTRMPQADGAGAGYVRENIDWFCCTVPDGLTPINQDGEVAQFALMDAAQLTAALRQGEFTLEAALILAAVMQL
jgi:8-oxo-dGTP pyrophosphatase MutT (NUDIX family)